jgi:glycosyltransferase involved in cell wall biosynthesis
MLAVPSVVLETGPLVVLEALAHGIPILGSRLGGIAELVEEGSNGWLLPPGEVPAWADALRQLAREPQRLEALMFSPKSPRGWDEVAAENAAVYQEVLQASAVLR